MVFPSGEVLWVPPINYLLRCQQEDDSVTNCVLKSVKPHSAGTGTVFAKTGCRHASQSIRWG